jgi:hypothetical protein
MKTCFSSLVAILKPMIYVLKYSYDLLIKFSQVS